MRMFVRALVGAITVAMMSAGVAQATTNAPPVTAPDAVTVMAGQPAEPDVLANDSDPDGDSLALCRLGSIPSGLSVDVFEGQLMVFAIEPGTYRFTYYACDYTYLTPGAVTVTVKPLPHLFVKVVKGERPGILQVTNNGKFGFGFLWGSYKKQHEDGRVRVPAHSTVRVRVRRVSLVWVAVNERKGAFKFGIVRGIQLPKGIHALAPGAPPIGAGPYRPRWSVSAG